MEAATCAQSFRCCGSPLTSDKIILGKKPNGFVVRFPQKVSADHNSKALRWRSSRDSTSSGSNAFQLSCFYNKNTRAPAFETKKDLSFIDEPALLKKKSQEIAPYLSGRCIYLVGMMGSGKTTVGKILSEVLGYSFFDSDKLVEQAVGGTPVAQIFKQYSESFFRDTESEVLRELSGMHRLVVATGGGAVIRPINWKSMKKGITVWLDVPLEALARRIAAVGTDSRPLLHQESGDPYTKALVRLSTLSEERGDAYANADARVSLEYIASKLGLGDVGDLSPTAIAIEDCIGAIDGTHIPATVVGREVSRFRNRHGKLSQNVLAACNFDLQFIYVLSGWEGSAHDSKVLNDAISRRNGLKIPSGKYYLGDCGFPNRRRFLSPFRGTRYHLKDFGGPGNHPVNAIELFNLRHASLRNVIERIFEIFKSRFTIFKSAPPFPYKTQAELVLACAGLHNFLRQECRSDEFPPEPENDPVENDEDNFEWDDFQTQEQQRENANQWRMSIVNQMWAAAQANINVANNDNEESDHDHEGE